MLSGIIQLTEEEFYQQTLCSRNALSTDFNNSSFRKGPTFSLAMQEQAVNYCQRLMTKSLNSLLIKGKYCFTIWIQDQNTNPQKTDINPNISVESSNVITQEPHQTQEIKAPQLEQLARQQRATLKPQEDISPIISTKKITRTYRGQTYEVEVSDYSAIQQALQNQKKPRKKYRGQYID